MKKTYLLMVLLGLSIAVMGQKKPKLNQAKALWAEGKLEEAKTIVDAGILHEKTKDDAKAWYYRFLVYASMDTSSTIDAPGALETALEAFDKYEEINGDKTGEIISDPNGGPVPLNDELVTKSYSDWYFKQGADAYQNADKTKAADMFESASKFIPNDTLANAYAGYAASDTDQQDRGIRLLTEALDNGATDPNIFLQLINIYNSNERFEEGLSMTQRARKSHPDRQDLARIEVSILVKLDRAEQALARIDEAIISDPNNAVFYFTKGLLLEELERTDEALEAYEQAAGKDPNHYEANYNIGVIYLNRANDLLKEKNGLGISAKDQKRSKELDPQIKERLKKALPIWEKVYEIKNDEQATLETLSFIYNYLGMKDKATEFQDKLEAMGG